MEAHTRTSRPPAESLAPPPHAGAIDATSQAEFEARLTQRLEAVGQLAAGIAHELNTPIQYVGDSVHFLRGAFTDLCDLVGVYQRALAALGEGPEHAALLAAVRDAEEVADVAYLTEHVPRAFERTFHGVQRVAGIVRAMREFAHPDARAMAPADLVNALVTTLTVARGEYKYVADVETRFEPLPPVVCHVGELNQVFLNLLVNAAHAIADVVGTDGKRRGRIELRAWAEADDVLVTIADTGGGIPPEVRQRVFDPFFTTKPVGRGTGQGLAIARAIVVERHGGALTFETELGRGTTFCVRVPIRGPQRASGARP